MSLPGTGEDEGFSLPPDDEDESAFDPSAGFDPSADDEDAAGADATGAFLLSFR